MKNAATIRNQIIREYRKAFESGSDAAWKKYRRFLNKLAKEVDADSAELLEDWAFNTAYNLS